MPDGPAVEAAQPSVLRACCYLAWLSWQRQARAHMLVILSLILLIATALLFCVLSYLNLWSVRSWRYRVVTEVVAPHNAWNDLTPLDVRTVPRLGGINGSAPLTVACAVQMALHEAALHPKPARTMSEVKTVGTWVDSVQMSLLCSQRPGASGGDLAVLGAVQAAMKQSPFRVFTGGLLVGFGNGLVQVPGLFFGFLLPIWSLAFASEALGGDRENNSLIWLLSRPIPRPAIYLTRYVAQLPWSATLNLGGFAILCVCAGAPGRQALRLYWPAVVWATLAFTALFHLFGAFLRRPAVYAIMYTFFLEILLNLMPGYPKRISLSFYARCLVYDEGSAFGVAPENPANYLAVSGTMATLVLAGSTLVLLAFGAWLFGRTQVADGV
jgi:ABC-type transport system involved in multi-copper enzyme maturation permease subunit